jgi:hypothetical protein
MTAPSKKQNHRPISWNLNILSNWLSLYEKIYLEVGFGIPEEQHVQQPYIMIFSGYKTFILTGLVINYNDTIP